MKNVFFKPWVGENYHSTGISGKKILILGESHICGGCDKCGDLSITDTDCRNFTTDVMKSFLDYKDGKLEHKRWMNTFTKFGNVFNNKSLSAEETSSFLNSVIFYNYVQYSTSEARTSPLAEEFEKSTPAFYEILQSYKPDLIIVWGKRLSAMLPLNGEIGNEEIMFGNENRGPLNYYTIENKKIPAFIINHPSSSRFDYSWHESIKAVVEMI